MLCPLPSCAAADAAGNAIHSVANSTEGDEGNKGAAAAAGGAVAAATTAAAAGGVDGGGDGFVDDVHLVGNIGGGPHHEDSLDDVQRHGDQVTGAQQYACNNSFVKKQEYTVLSQSKHATYLYTPCMQHS